MQRSVSRGVQGNMETVQLHKHGRTGRLKAFPNAMGSYHMPIAVESNGDGVRNFPQTVVCRLTRYRTKRLFSATALPPSCRRVRRYGDAVMTTFAAGWI